MEISATRPEELGWIRIRTGVVLSPSAKGIKATDRLGVIRGMVAYDCWTPNSVTAHMAVDTPIAWRSLVRPAFAYPFQTRGLILGIIRSSNVRSVETAERLGFTLAHRVRDGYATGDDSLLFEMRREDCRWIQ